MDLCQIQVHIAQSGICSLMFMHPVFWQRLMREASAASLQSALNAHAEHELKSAQRLLMLQSVQSLSIMLDLDYVWYSESFWLQIALKCSDIGHLSCPRALHQRWTAQLREEFLPTR